jgi:anti-anti-sigma regulatory factor
VSGDPPGEPAAAVSGTPRAAYRGAVRAAGLISDSADVTVADHVCWVDHDQAAFDAAVRDFAACGLDRSERLLAVGERVIDSLRRGRPPLGDLARLISQGSLETLTTAQAYGDADTFDPEGQLEFYDAATRRALRDGRSGLRVLADISPLAVDPARRTDLVRWEHLADDFVAHGPGMSAMCIYGGDLDPDTLTEAASAHPLAHVPQVAVPSFRLFFEDGRLVIVGSVDTFDAGRLARLLATSPVPAPTATVDLSRVEFIDVAGCRTIGTWAQQLHRRGLPVSVVGASRLVRRMWQLLGLTEVAPVAFVEAAA